ncbi:AMP-binding protein [Zhongshania sp. BJYM1]|uniref:AMP-binding protein n=1 Tax=Zhongshania aquatica TaxID=2965069 RepID=UPI0022B4BA1A|nr:AMP-binding protein [Marortus sp. BJYM1]
MTPTKYDEPFLAPRSANYIPLTPTSLIRRAAQVYPDYVAIEYGTLSRSWKDTYVRCAKIANALKALEVDRNSTVSALLPNTPHAVELAYAVPMSGGVLNMINTRLKPEEIAFILDHGEAEVFFVDSGLAELAKSALSLAKVKPTIIYCDDTTAPGVDIDNAIDYEDFLRDAAPLSADNMMPANEWDSIALNYTSGTTGNPKGVVYHHRGAYLNALGNGLEWSLPLHFRYLWTLPLFHCNGWCFPWTIAAYAGTHVCLRAPEATAILDALTSADITHMCGAPIILNMATTEAEKQSITLKSPVKCMVAGAAPPAAVLARASKIGFDITHVYGLTEVYGPTAICAWKKEWNQKDDSERATLKSRQGVNYAVQEELSVRDPDTMEQIVPNAEIMGEVMFRGNIVMKGYLKNPDATENAFKGGHFRSGDLAVMHQDRYVEIRDRSKDIIISGGENVSSIEVEGVLYQHDAVSLAAVVAAPHEKWGETPVAFIELKEGMTATGEEIIEFTRQHLAHFKCPRQVIFTELPKTSTGKIQKFVIRDQAKDLFN